MLIGYARVSTDDQVLNLQMDALTKAGVERVYTDTASGAKVKREGLTKALREVEPGDVLVVWKLDRLARSLGQLIEIAQYLEKRGIGFRSLTEAIDTTTPGGRLIFHVMGALAEFERALIVERTKAGLEAAKARGQKVGRKLEATPEKLEQARALILGGSSYKAAAKAVGLAESTLYRDLPGGRAALVEAHDVDIPAVEPEPVA